MWSFVLKRGMRLSLTDVRGGGAVAALFYNAERLMERYNMPDTLKAQQVARLTAGCALYSDMGRVLCSVVADSLGWHDTVTGHGDARHAEAHYGAHGYQAARNERVRNTRDNFLVELGKYGLTRRDISANVNFFVKVVPDDDGNLRYVADHSGPGSTVELRAEMPTLVVLSNTPHPLDPRTTYQPGVVSLELTRGPVAPADDPVRLFCPENGRGFELTERLFL